MTKNGKKKFLFILLSVGLFFGIFLGKNILAQTCTSQENCSQLIKEYEGKITELQGQAKTLKNQIAQFDAQIKLTGLKIADTESKISMLGGRIDQLEGSLESLTKAFASRAVETYKISKFENNFMLILTANDINDAVSRFHYLKKVQEEDRNLLVRLQEAQTTYIGQKEDQETLQANLQKEKNNLSLQKTAKNQLLADTKNSESTYQKLVADAKAQLAAFSRFVSGQGGASILSGTTKDDPGWGTYYNQRDSQWGNRAIGMSSISVADAGCLITSMAMIMTHYNKSANPGDIASNPNFFSSYPPYADFRQGSLTINGVSTTRTRVGYSQSALDSELSSGNPVIVGVSPYGSQKPEHFVVVKKKEGSDYIMNDPFIENGMNATFTSHYPISSIRAVDRVTMN